MSGPVPYQRRIDARYQDPLEVVWLHCARSLGLRIERSSSVYASYDGASTLTLTTAEHFDPDDSLAQLIFHELCHALVAGPRGLEKSDWGMSNTDASDLLSEHACHRLQAALADRHGVRALFAVTTDHRAYWDALPLDPLAPSADPAVGLAREAYQRATTGPWAEAIDTALRQTAQLAEVVRATHADAQSLWHRTQALHVSGFPLGEDPKRTCGACGFSFEAGGTLRCRKTRALPHARGVRVTKDARACVRFEPKLDEETCAQCGACCREAFDRVDVRPRELLRKRHPALVSVDGYGPHLARPHGRCVALEASDERYRCRIYADRPRACRDFEIAGDACLVARRRVGLSA